MMESDGPSLGYRPLLLMGFVSLYSFASGCSFLVIWRSLLGVTAMVDVAGGGVSAKILLNAAELNVGIMET